MAFPKTDLLPDPLTLTAIAAETMRARIKFPENELLTVALMEEVGELAQAQLQGRPRDEIEREALQVAALAVRILEEGDRSLAHRSPLPPKRGGEHA
jgi:NTP pyrophosphatase (non-canonical NTP hydrolase)